ncbi:MAG TPA: hypothetical protein VM715_22340 [Candidatus Acidoferrum sp.]|nr:hypothetical protein [Candidatus Acidoferrum sp.]
MDRFGLHVEYLILGHSLDEAIAPYGAVWAGNAVQYEVSALEEPAAAGFEEFLGDSQGSKLGDRSPIKDVCILCL